jgi:Transposase DDE domain
VRENLKFPGARVAFKWEREVRDVEATVVLFETRYFIASLDSRGCGAAVLMALARKHWQVENSLHFVKDRWWDEDRHYSKRPGLAGCLAGLVNAALTVLRVGWPFDSSLALRGRADQLAWDPVEALKVIRATPL